MSIYGGKGGCMRTDDELCKAYNQWTKHTTGTIEVIFCTPEIVEPDIRMSILVDHARKVSFSLEASVKVWRDECGGPNFGETKQVGGSDLNAEPG